MKKENTTHLSYVAYSSHLLLTSSRKLHFQYFLTESFNQTNSKAIFDYNILYRISENQWWNSLLIMSSFTISVVVFISLVNYKKRKLSKV